VATPSLAVARDTEVRSRKRGIRGDCRVLLPFLKEAIALAADVGILHLDSGYATAGGEQ